MTDMTKEAKYKIPQRSKADIDLEYTQCATKAGDLEFRIQTVKGQVNSCYSRMRQLEKEAKELAESEKVKETKE